MEAKNQVTSEDMFKRLNTKKKVQTKITLKGIGVHLILIGLILLGIVKIIDLIIKLL